MGIAPQQAERAIKRIEELECKIDEFFNKMFDDVYSHCGCIDCLEKKECEIKD